MQKNDKKTSHCNNDDDLIENWRLVDQEVPLFKNLTLTPNMSS